eukprot:scaffold672_cov268-Pinguiococcus_pyrenoidosus.AAC.3
MARTSRVDIVTGASLGWSTGGATRRANRGVRSTLSALTIVFGENKVLSISSKFVPGIRPRAAFCPMLSASPFSSFARLAFGVFAACGATLRSCATLGPVLPPDIQIGHWQRGTIAKLCFRRAGQGGFFDVPCAKGSFCAASSAVSASFPP